MNRLADLLAGLAIVIVLGAAFSTPAVSYEYDAAGWWIPHAELERAHAGAIVDRLRTRDTLPQLQPWLGVHRYPIAFPMIVGALSRLVPSGINAARVAAFWTALGLVSVFVALRRRIREDGEWAMLLSACVLACPFVFVHVRSGYVDLSVGAAAALFVIAMVDLVEPSPRRFAGARLVIFGTLLVQLKLEGAVHAVVAAITVCLFARTATRGRRTGVALLSLAVAAINVAAWQIALRLIPDQPLPPALFVWDSFRASVLPVFAIQVFRHAIDYVTWGAIWPVLLAVAVATQQRAALALIVGVLAVFAVLHAGGPPVMMVWAERGTQLNRLLLEILIAAWPLAAGLLAGSNRSTRFVSTLNARLQI